MAMNPRTGRPYTREELAMLQDSQLDAEQGYGDEASRSYLDRAKSFDPTAALNTYAQGAWGSISEALDERLRSMRGQAVGSGRIDTGFFDEDNGEVVRGAARDFSHAVSQRALDAVGMQQRNTEGLAAFGGERTRNALDLTAARREETENDYREEQERKRRRKSGIASAIGGVLGAGAAVATGNPWAVGAGWKAGSSVGRAASGY